MRLKGYGLRTRVGQATVHGVLILCGAAILLSGCGRKAEEPEVVPEPEPLARVGDRVITEAEFAFEVERRLASGRPMDDADSVLRDLIEREAMLIRAAADEALRDPAVQRELENHKLVQWLDRSLQVLKDEVRVSEDDLRAAYEADMESFTRPALARLAILYRRVSLRDPDETMKSLRAELEAARELYLADPAAATRDGRIPGFGAIAADHSEDQVSRYRGGDLGWLDTSRTDHRWPEEVVQAGFALEPGEVSPVLVTDEGLFVVMKSGWREEQVTPFEEASIVLRRRVIRSKQEAVEREFMSNVLASVDVRINPEKAERLAIPQVPQPVAPELLPVTGRTPNQQN